MTINNAINFDGIDRIVNKSILKYILNIDETELIVNADRNLTDEQEQAFLKLIEEIEKGKPLQYITNKQEFWGLEFYVDENVLIPQPDTEILVEQACILAQKYSKCKILDLCTGSGAIAISIKFSVKNAEIEASDISEKALQIANKNAINNDTKIKFIKSNMFENINGKYDLIVSNPPYIRTDVINTLAKDVQAEPKIALDGGKDGLKFYRIIKENVSKFLNPTGSLLMEIGFDQKEEVLNLFQGAECIKDYNGKDRVIIWKPSQVK